MEALRSYQLPRALRLSTPGSSGPVTKKSTVLSSPNSSSVSTVRAMLAEPCQLSRVRRVMMLITPPMASAPYSVDIGPRITSMRSIASSGGMWLNWLPPKLFG